MKKNQTFIMPTVSNTVFTPPTYKNICVYLVFDHQPFLKQKIEGYLLRRQHLKDDIEKNSDPSKLIALQIQASLIKLLINSGM